ncbi:MAG TPA: hypothetical protein V6C97_22550 [Oculatellaceae cyanobacterium]
MPFTPKFAPKYAPKFAGPTVLERVIAGFCYFSCGLVGLIYILLTGQTGRQTDFFRFNFLQSIVLGLLGILAGYAGNLVIQMLGGAIGIFSSTAANMMTSPVALLQTLLQGLYYILVLYGAIWAFLGKQAQIPLLTKLVRQQM